MPTIADSRPKFFIGQLIRHKKFGYRGVIADVDPIFMGTDEWYEQVARSRPPRDRPWYRVLVHEARHETYVAERHLAAEPNGEPVDHPLVEQLFDHFEQGVYRTLRH